MSTKAIWNIKSQQLIMLERSVTFFFLHVLLSVHVKSKRRNRKEWLCTQLCVCVER